MRIGVQVVVVCALSVAHEARAADAVFDAEFWQSATDIERVEDLEACADSGFNQRRSIRSTTAVNIASYDLWVGDTADVGDYQMWARVRIPESSTRTILVGLDTGGSFQSPEDAFVVTSGAGEVGYRWLSVTRQGSGSAGSPEFDPWLLWLTQSASSFDVRLVDDDIHVDRFAVSNATMYTPPSCPPYVASDGGPQGDVDRISGAQDNDCERPRYYDLHAGKCVAPVERGCAASVGSAWVVLVLLARRPRRRPSAGGGSIPGR